MRPKHLRAPAITLTLLAVAVIGPMAGASAKTKPSKASAPAYKLANVGPYGGEPSIAVNTKGQLYDTTRAAGRCSTSRRTTERRGQRRLRPTRRAATTA